MASFEVNAVKGEWINVSTAISVAAGVKINIQNRSGHNIVVETSAVEPSSPSLGLERTPQAFAASIPGVSEFVWAFGIDADSPLNVQVAS